MVSILTQQCARALLSHETVEAGCFVRARTPKGAAIDDPMLTASKRLADPQGLGEHRILQPLGSATVTSTYSAQDLLDVRWRLSGRDAFE